MTARLARVIDEASLVAFGRGVDHLVLVYAEHVTPDALINIQIDN